MKNSGGGSPRATDYVFDFVGRNTEVVGDVSHTVAGHETVDEILNTSTTVDDKRQAERDCGVYDNLSAAVRRETNARSPAVLAICDLGQVIPNQLGELMLSGSHDDELKQLTLVTAGRVVEEHLSPSVYSRFEARACSMPMP